MSILLKPHKIQMYAGEKPREVYDFDFSFIGGSSTDVSDFLKKIKQLEADKKLLQDTLDKHHQEILDVAEGRI